MEKHIVRTNLLGVNLSLKVDADPEHISKIIEYIEQKGQEVRDKFIETDPHRISVLTNILLADELFAQCRTEETSGDESQPASHKQVDRLAQELIQLISDKIEEE